MKIMSVKVTYLGSRKNLANTANPFLCICRDGDGNHAKFSISHNETDMQILL